MNIVSHIFPVGNTLSTALWLAGIGHFVILLASFQVPRRLGWKEDLAKLDSLNRKLMWTYGGFTVFTIIGFGIITLAFHANFLRGDPLALGLAGFIGIYWTVRIAVDFFYFGHEGWPRGNSFVVGHVMLIGLFVALAGTYLGLVSWHVLFS